MESKIDVSVLLKDCPKGMELDCTMIDNVVFEKLDFISSYHPIIIRRTDSNKTIHLTKYGQYSDEEDYKCVIFPKGKTTWEGFAPPCQFKDGDIVSTMNGIWIGIVKRPVSGAYETYVTIYGDSLVYNDNIFCFERFATKEEKQKFFKAIKDGGYKWNPETKTLEKLVQSRFKVGDRIKKDKDYKSGIITNISDDGSYKVEYQGGGVSYVHPAYQDEWELVPNKFDIKTLVPFESKVLVRDSDREKWKSNFWGFYDDDHIMNYPYECCGASFAQCIPYEGNEHLLGTNNDCDKYFKIWE